MNLPFAPLVFICASVFAKGGEYRVIPEHTVTSHDGKFSVEQRAVTEGDWAWQTWIHPTSRKQEPYPLQLWHEGELPWAGNFHISGNGRYILQTQKTGSGDNYGALFILGKDGKIHLRHSVQPAPNLSQDAWQWFREKTGKAAVCYHAGIDFISWGADGKCVEISLHGTDCYEKYAVRDWQLHYNIATGLFFQTPDQLRHNRNAIVERSEER